MKSKVKIDWDTVELVGALSPPAPVPIQPERPARLFPDRSIVKQILSGAAAKARARGAFYTHTQLRKHLPIGLEMLIYGWRLVAAAVESDRDITRGVEAAAHAIHETSARLSTPRRSIAT